MIHTWGFKVNPLSQLWLACLRNRGSPSHPPRPPDLPRAYFFSVAEYLELSVPEISPRLKDAVTSQLVDFQ